MHPLMQAEAVGLLERLLGDFESRQVIPRVHADCRVSGQKVDAVAS